MVRIAEIEVIGRAERYCARAGEISSGFGDCDFAAFVRIEIGVSCVAVHGDSDELLNSRSAPVLGRSIVRMLTDTGRCWRPFLIVHCCARAPAHSLFS